VQPARSTRRGTAQREKCDAGAQESARPTENSVLIL
jgi:hypothetical protein